MGLYDEYKRQQFERQQMKNQFTDEQLKLALVKMMPEKLIILSSLNTPAYVAWKVCFRHSSKVQETEWLHVCWLIEQELDNNQTWLFERALKQVCLFDDTNKKGIQTECSASWQQRAIALAQVKGIIV